MNCGIYDALELLMPNLKEKLLALGKTRLEKITEIRLRNEKPVSVDLNGNSLFINSQSELIQSTSQAIMASSQDIEYSFKTAFSYSLHSFSKELSMGYITTKGGNRVGVCGTAVVYNEDRESIETVKNISSLNIRISHEVCGFADRICGRCFYDGPKSVLIIGLPASGKTTLLRDIAKNLGGRYKLSLIDEQNEISATYRNSAQNNVGKLTDIFVGYPKHKGISIAVRVMSPSVIIADEIGSMEDYKAIEFAHHSGVKVITAVHGNSLQQIKCKPAINAMLAQKMFDYCAIMNKNFSYDVISLD